MGILGIAISKRINFDLLLKKLAKRQKYNFFYFELGQGFILINNEKKQHHEKTKNIYMLNCMSYL